MKKWMALVAFSALFCAVLTGCGSESDNSALKATEPETTAISEVTTEKTTEMITTMETVTTAAETTTTITEDSRNLEVERGDETTTITIPASLISDLDATVSEAESDSDVVSYTVNEDGSITYVYRNDAYQKKVEQMRTNFDDAVSKVLDSGNYQTITAIEGDDSLKNIDITVTNQQDYENSMDGFVMLGLYIYAGYYQVLEDQSETFSVQYHWIDASTGQEFSTVTYPDDIG